MKEELVLSLKKLKNDGVWFSVIGLDDVDGMTVITLPQGYNE